MRRIVLCATAVVLAVTLQHDRAEAACTESQITVRAPLANVSGSIPVGWLVQPACDVIETGLLVGSDPDQLSKAGQPFYGAADSYDDTVNVRQSGEYWIAAYVRDEAGMIIQSSPVPVIAALVSAFDDAIHGSHGQPPRYTGADADFLQPAGQPTFAALRAGTFTSRSSSTSFNRSGAITSSGVTGSREAASTHREEISATLTSVDAGGVIFPIDTNSVAQSLGVFDLNFPLLGFPRTGLYAVGCSAPSFVPPGRSDPPSVICQADGLTLSSRTLTVEYEDGVLQSNFLPGFRNTSTVRSSLTYFVPRPPAGQRIQSAILQVQVNGTGDFSALSLGGTPVTSFTPFACAPSFCNGLATWDFTAQAQALASAGGGPLTLSLDPIPPFVRNRGFNTSIEAFYAFQAAVNYPWSHGGPLAGAFTITFAQACPKSLALAIDPPTVRPDLPQNTVLTGTLANRLSRATATATVKTCPPPGGGSPDSVQVFFEVQRPTTLAEFGGHSHVSGHPIGTPSTATCLVTAFDAQGIGSCSVTYRAPVVSGTEKIVASAPNFVDTTPDIKVKIEVPDLMNLAEIRTNFFRLTGQTGTHPDNHWGTLETTLKAQLLALDFFAQFGAKIGINDMSLPAGGLFDICGTWNPGDGCTLTRTDGSTTTIKKGHFWHRTGRGVDVDRGACLDPNLTGQCGKFAITDLAFEYFCNQRGTRFPEATLHCEF